MAVILTKSLLKMNMQTLQVIHLFIPKKDFMILSPQLNRQSLILESFINM